MYAKANCVHQSFPNLVDWT